MTTEEEFPIDETCEECEELQYECECRDIWE